MQELREVAGLSRDALAKKAGVSLEMVSRIEGGESIPTGHVAARLTCGH
ncbi:MAG: helix-turn-helix transcriptional regulator [Chthoniobacteraceae bacterium]